ncbi:MAG: UDP-N-acetylmuramoyl-L-alanyl-D-glutamate--2,6-diaminopimelate ligase [Candidatus Eremiobacterota bacterium]
MPTPSGFVSALVPEGRWTHPPPEQFASLAASSRDVEPGGLFVCLRGARVDGHDFAPDALQRGALALVVERPLPLEVPQWVVPDTRVALARLAALFTGRPTDRMTMVGITGTNGKSTTAYLTEAVLLAGGYRPGLIGTIEARIGGQARALPNTTPDALTLYRLFGEMEAAGQDALVMEVSSIGLEALRVLEIPYDVSVFTNLTQDHLDYHPGMEAYYLAKERLFRQHQFEGRRHPPQAVLNADDPASERLAVGFRGQVWRYGLRGGDLQGLEPEAREQGMFFRLRDPRGRSWPVQLRLGGGFNVLNALAALGVGWSLGIEPEAAIAAIESVECVPGRFQEIRCGQPFRVVVDYAHTPDGLKNLLESARHVATGRVLVVFGCGGDRDRAKRPMMGRIAADLADGILLTNDNPRSEQPRAILADIEAGMAGCAYEVEPDRARAIARAVEQARPGDIVVIAGKGHENYQIVGKEVFPFDDAEVAREALRGFAPPLPEQGVRGELGPPLPELGARGGRPLLPGTGAA